MRTYRVTLDYVLGRTSEFTVEAEGNKNAWKQARSLIRVQDITQLKIFPRLEVISVVPEEENLLLKYAKPKI